MSDNKIKQPHFKVKWVDRHMEPSCKANPKYPNGIDVDTSNGSAKTCSVDLPYPAKRCGYYEVDCLVCRLSAVITTAGRADDPKSVKLACKAKLH